MPGGRPRLYEDAEAFSAAVESYFDKIKLDDKLMPTMAGLCYHLGFEDKDSFSHYDSYGGEFSRTVKRARLRIEDDRNQRLAKSEFSPGIIFDLKNNYGWKDKTESEITGADGGPLQTVTKVVLTGPEE
jgi:hypothetical protein